MVRGTSWFGLCFLLSLMAHQHPHSQVHVLAIWVYSQNPLFSLKCTCYSLWLEPASAPTPSPGYLTFHVSEWVHSLAPPPGWAPQSSALMRSCLLRRALATLRGYCFPSCLSSPPGCKYRSVRDYVCLVLHDIPTRLESAQDTADAGCTY